MLETEGPLAFASTAAGGAASPKLFGVAVPLLAATFVAQALACGFLLTMARRKLGDPGQRSLGLGPAVALFALVVFVQHGLVWHIHSDGPLPGNPTLFGWFLLADATTVILGLVLVGAGCLRRDRVVVDLFPLHPGGLRRLLCGGGPALGLAMALVATAATATQVSDDLQAHAGTLAVFGAGFVLAFTAFGFIVEVGRIWFGRWAWPFVAVTVAVLYLLPLVLGVSNHPEWAALSVLAPPRVWVMGTAESRFAAATALGIHTLIDIGLLVAWSRSWALWRRRLRHEWNWTGTEAAQSIA